MGEMTREKLIVLLSGQALAAILQGIAAFERVQGRVPTLAEWQELQAGWKSPDEIEREVRAGLAGGG